MRTSGSGQQYGGTAWPGEALAAWYRVSWKRLLGWPRPGEILGRKPQASLKGQRGLFERKCFQYNYRSKSGEKRDILSGPV